MKLIDHPDKYSGLWRFPVWRLKWGRCWMCGQRTRWIWCDLGWQCETPSHLHNLAEEEMDRILRGYEYSP